LRTYRNIKDWSTRFTKDETVRRSFYTLITQGAGRFLGVIAFILLARMFDPQLYGQIIFGNSMARLAANILMLGAMAVLVKEWGQSLLTGRERERGISFVANWYLAIGMLSLILILLGTYGFLSSFLAFDTVIVEYLAFLYVVPLFALNIFQSYFISIKKTIFSGYLLVVFNGYWVVFLVVFDVIGPQSVKDVLAGLAIGSFVLALLVVFFQYYKFGLKASKSRFLNRSFIFSHWGAVLFAHIDIILIQWLLSDSDLAYYGVALQLSLVVAFILAGVNASIVSNLSEGYVKKTHDDFQYDVRKYAKINFIFSSIVIFALIVFGSYICALFGDAYIESYYLLVILMIGQSVNVLNGANGWLLNVSGYEHVVVRAFYVAIIPKIVLGILLIELFGSIGMALASSFSLIIWNLILTRACLIKIDINPTMLKWS